MPFSHRILRCTACKYTTNRKSFMEDHKRIHTGERPYPCDVCGKTFTQKSNLNKHLLVHGVGDRTFECEECDFTTKYKQSLKMHENWHQGIKPFPCDICGKCFSQSTHRRTHMMEAHSDERQYICDVCTKGFKRKEHLQRHMLFHKNERDRECDICRRRFNTSRGLATHMLVHGGEETKVHKCELCPYKTRYKQALKIHYYMHLGVRPYKCQVCPKAFRTSQVLKIHMRMVHEGEAGKIFQCDQCRFSSAHKQILKSHILRIHMGVKQTKSMSCPVCNKIYLSSSSLHNHKRKKHPILLKNEQVARMREKLNTLRKVFPERDIKEGNEALDDYRYTITNLAAKSMVQKAKAQAWSNAKRKETNENGNGTESNEKTRNVVKSIRKEGKGKLKKSKRIKHVREKLESVVKKVEAKTDNDGSDGEFYSVVEQDCGNSMEPRYGSERAEDIDTLFEDEQAVQKCVFEDDIIEAKSLRHSKKKNNNDKAHLLLPNEPMESKDDAVTAWLRSVRAEIVPSSGSYRWSPDDVPVCPPPKTGSMFRRRKHNGGSMEDKKMKRPPVNDSPFIPNVIEKRRIVRRDGHTVIYDDDPLAGLPISRQKLNKAPLTIAERLEQAMAAAPPGSKGVIHDYRPPGRPPNKKRQPVQVNRPVYKTMGQRVPIPDPACKRTVPPTAPVLKSHTIGQRVPIGNPVRIKQEAVEYDSLRSMASEYIQSPEWQEQIAAASASAIASAMAVPMKQEHIVTVKEEPVDNEYESATASSSTLSVLTSITSLSHHALGGEVRRSPRKRKTRMNHEDMMEFLGESEESGQVLEEVCHPEEVEEVEELVEYIDVKEEFSMEEDDKGEEVFEEEAEKIVEEYRDENSCHDLRHFASAMAFVKVEKDN